MEQCYDCGAPCGRRHTIGWMNNSDFLCDSCARKRMSNGVKAFGGFQFLFLGVVLSVVVAMNVLKPIAAVSGYGTAKGVAIGIGVGGVVLYFVFRYVAGKTTGCLFRMIIKTVGFFAYALGIGLLFVTFLIEGQLKNLIGVTESDNNTPAEEVGRP